MKEEVVIEFVRNIEDVLKLGRSLRHRSTSEAFMSYLRTYLKPGNAKLLFLDRNPKGEESLYALVAWGLDEGILAEDKEEFDMRDDENNLYFSLTEKGKDEIKGQSL